jgi:DNA-binding CsgD family transcriptional regulator
MKKILLALFLSIWNLSAQEITPYFKNYTKLEYNGENTNWDLSQHSDGTIYIANGKNLLSFNGDFWQKKQLPKPLTLRSVNVINDTIYTGAYHQFGYWVKDNKNELNYTSLSDSIPHKQFNNDEIWKILEYKDKILFQSFTKLFVYHPFKNKIEIISFGNVSGVYSFIINDEVYITTRNNGIFKLVKDHFEFVEWSTPLKDFTVQSMAPFKGGILIATQLNGLYYYDGQELKPWQRELTSQFEFLEINNLKILNDFICVGTINNGLLVFDISGSFKYIFNKKNGLANNTVLRQFEDKDHNLWIALDNGLSKIHLSNQVYGYNDTSGTLGTVYTIIDDADGLVLGSNHGVFYLKGEELEFLKSSNGQVWNLTRVGDEIICGHNNGTFSIKNNQFSLINDISGGMDFKRIPNTELFIQPNYTGLAHYQKVNGEWVYKRYSEIDFPINSIYFDEKDHLWIESAHRGIFQYKFLNDHKELQLLKKFASTSSQNKLFGLENKIFISGKNKVFRYDVVNDTLLRDPILERKLSPFDEISSLNPEILVAENKNSQMIFNITASGSFNLNEDLVNNRIVKNFPGATALSNDVFMLMDDGFLKIRPSAINKESSEEMVSLEVVKVNGERMPVKERVKIPYKKNLIYFRFSNKAPGNISLPTYSYKLDGYDNSWSVPSGISEVSYNNLPAGDFVFKVKPESSLNDESTTMYMFSILQPWYLSNWAWFGYVSILIMGVLLINYYNKLKFINKKKALERELEFEHKLVIQKQNFENNRIITELEQEKLKGKLKSKSKELASYAALMARKEDILAEMEKEINNSNIKKENQKLYLKLMDIKDRQSNSQNEWKLFERNFHEVHDDFFKILQNKYPGLTPNDLKLCAFLRMNLSSKEIAPLIGITFRSIELHRYRLRKKFQLSKKDNLVKILMNLD